MDRSWQSCLSALGQAIIALLLSALVLIGGFAMYTDARIPPGANREQSKEIAVDSLRAVTGTAVVRSGQLSITSFAPTGPEYRAIVVSRLALSAASYPSLRYAVSGEDPAPTLKLVWRTARNPRSMYAVALNHPGDNAASIKLAGHPQWQGTIVELGIYASTRNPDVQLAIRQLTLQPHSWSGLLASHWSSWTTLRGWTVRSVNFLYGTSDVLALSPNLVGAAWAGLALLLVLVITRIASADPRAAIVAVILLAWIALDMLWQRELEAQLDQTSATFAGKSQHEKHLADIDNYIYSYVQRLKAEVLPAQPVRIFLLHDSTGHNFRRLKAQYYLLPHNVYSFGRTPPGRGMQKGDYILALGDFAQLDYNPGRGQLAWKKGRVSLAVKRLDSDPLGNLYQAASADIVKRDENNRVKVKRKAGGKNRDARKQRNATGDKRT